jgi:hypothetical protein
MAITLSVAEGVLFNIGYYQMNKDYFVCLKVILT